MREGPSYLLAVDVTAMRRASLCLAIVREAGSTVTGLTVHAATNGNVISGKTILPTHLYCDEGAL